MNVTTELKELIKQATSQILCMQVHINKGYGNEEHPYEHEKVTNLSVGYSQAELDEFLSKFDFNTWDEEYSDIIHTEPDATVWFADDSWATLEVNDGGRHCYWYYHVKPQLV